MDFGWCPSLSMRTLGAAWLTLYAVRLACVVEVGCHLRTAYLVKLHRLRQERFPSRYRASSMCFVQIDSLLVPCWLVTKRRSSWACRGNPKPEQETIEGTHAQETPACQRRPTTLHEGQGSNPPIRAPYMQLAKIPHCLLYTSPSPRDRQKSRMPSSA